MWSFDGSSGGDQSRPYLHAIAPHGHAYVAVPLGPNGLPLMPNAFSMGHQNIMFNPEWSQSHHAYPNVDLSERMEGLYVDKAKQQRGGGPYPAKKQDKKPNEHRGPIMEDKIRRTIYISNIDSTATEAQVASFFLKCGPISDVRMCGDSGSKFAFIEFTNVEAVGVAIDLNGTVFHHHPIKILQSKTPIMPVNRELAPRSQDDIERCKRTVYVANIDKRMERDDVKRFFEGICGPISNMRLLGDNAHATRIAFVEFYTSDGAQAALQCSGAVLGSLPIRVSPSKTPLKPEPHIFSTSDEASSSDVADPSSVGDVAQKQNLE